MLKWILGFLTFTTAGPLDDSYIWRLTPLTFNTAFYASGKEMAISMPCGSAGLRDCGTVLHLLYSLTDTPACRERVFIAITDQSTFVSDGVADSALWYQFTYRRNAWERETEEITLDLQPFMFDCRPASG